MIVFDIPGPQSNPALLAMAAGAFVGVALGLAGEVARVHGYSRPQFLPHQRHHLFAEAKAIADRHGGNGYSAFPPQADGDTGGFGTVGAGGHGYFPL